MREMDISKVMNQLGLHMADFGRWLSEEEESDNSDIPTPPVQPFAKPMPSEPVKFPQ